MELKESLVSLGPYLNSDLWPRKGWRRMIDVSTEDTLDESTLGKSECRIWCNKNLLINTMKSIYSLESLILLRSSDACVWTAGIKHSLGIILGTFFTEGHIKYKMIQKKVLRKDSHQRQVPHFTVSSYLNLMSWCSCMFTHLEILNVNWMSPLQSLKRNWMS